MISKPETSAPLPVMIWLACVAAMVAAMVIIGGITRITESGLSMVEWRPLIGALPPMSEAEWTRVFELYRQTSEYALQNAGMSLDEFKRIFWWEYIHRLWGRLIGLAFALPFAVFVLRGMVRGTLCWKLAGMLVLGGLQGFMGWYMVKSGFVDRTDVSQYRLTAHLSLALLILALLVWLALDLRGERRRAVGIQAAATPPRVRFLCLAAFVLVSFTIVTGGFVAGLNAGLVYPSFPLMGGEIIPPDYFGPEYSGGGGFLSNALENPVAAQWHHRAAAMLTACFVLLLPLFASGDRVPSAVRTGVRASAVLAVCQAGLGIATLLSFVEPVLAVMHQGGAVMLFCAVVATLHAAVHRSAPV